MNGQVRFVIHVFAWRRSVSLKRLLDSVLYAKYFKGLDNLNMGIIFSDALLICTYSYPSRWRVYDKSRESR